MLPTRALGRWLCLGLLLCLVCLGGQQTEGAEGAAKRHPVDFRADHMTGKDNVWTLKSNVVLSEKKEEMTLKADQAVYWADEDRAELTGNISITDPEHSATADVVKADFNKKIIYLDGNVKVERTPKEAKQAAAAGENKTEEKKFSVEEAKKRRSTTTCDKMEYDYGKKFLTATGNVKVVQEKRTATCQKAEYDEEKEILTLAEGVKVEEEGGNWFECSRATINVDTDEVEAWDITGMYYYEEEKGKPAEAGAATTSEATTTTASETTTTEAAPAAAPPAGAPAESPPAAGQ